MIPIQERLPHPTLSRRYSRRRMRARGSGAAAAAPGSLRPPGLRGFPRRCSRRFPSPELPSPAQPSLAAAAGSPVRRGRSPGTAPAPQVPPRSRPARAGPRRRLPGPVRGCGTPHPAGQRLWGMEETGIGPPGTQRQLPSFGNSPASVPLRCAKVSQAFREKDPEDIQPKGGTSGFVHSSVKSKGSNWKGILAFNLYFVGFSLQRSVTTVPVWIFPVEITV